MRKCLLCAAVVILIALPALAEASVYRSNAFGMQLEPLPRYRKDEYRWVLEVARSAGGEIRKLFDNGKEARRWEVSGVAGGGTEEREIAGGSITARRLYSPAGELLEEDQYAKGALTKKSLFTYDASRLRRVRVLSADGKPVYTQEYFYTLRGSLREVRRTEPGGSSRESSFVSGSTGLSEERNEIDDIAFISRYDNRGRVIEKVKQGKDGVISTEELQYQEDSDHLLSSMEKEHGSGRTTERRYDKDGRLASETVTSGKKVLEENTYTRDDKGREIARMRRSPAGLEQWKESLDGSGKKIREEYLRRGSLAKVTVWGDGNTRTEELYESGQLFLKAYFDGDRRLKEEVYEGGKPVRTRSFE